MLPFALGRFRRTYEATRRKYADPSEGFARLYLDSCVYDPAVLAFLVARAGAERVMLGSDSPMSIAELHPVALVRAAGLDQSQCSAILGGNAQRVFRLRTDCRCGRPAPQAGDNHRLS